VGGLQVEVNALSLFRQGIEPKWEHPLNHGGGSFSVVCSNSLEALQQFYQTLVFAAIGETLPGSQHVCGIRFIDKYLDMKVFKLKIDIWMSA
jgi:hypothetical protein